MAGRSKKSGKGKKGTAGLGRIALIMAAAVIALFALIKYANTPRGRVLMLDMGFDRHYAAVQKDLGERIAGAAAKAGIPRAALEISRVEEADRPGPVAVVKGTAPAGSSLLQLNADVTEAVGGAGGRVRSCREKKDGLVIEMEIGTRRTVTHRCTFRIGRAETRLIPPAGVPALTVVVDDFGYFNNRLVREFLALEIPITVSVIPGLKYSEKICRQAREVGKEVICHIPMEPENGAGDQGDIPLVRTGMSGSDIVRVVEKALGSTPGASGISNHMGSKATSDMGAMEAVMKVCRRRKLFFFDSYTTARSVVEEAAEKAGVRTARNDLFLDNQGDDVRENIRKIVSIASRQGRAAAIMHVKKGNPEHLRFLAEEAGRKGVRIISLSEMIGD